MQTSLPPSPFAQPFRNSTFGSFFFPVWFSRSGKHVVAKDLHSCPTKQTIMLWKPFYIKKKTTTKAVVVVVHTPAMHARLVCGLTRLFAKLPLRSLFVTGIRSVPLSLSLSLSLGVWTCTDAGIDLLDRYSLEIQAQSGIQMSK